jgi:AraC family transcriptional regulator, transcriptional activator of pobA
MQLKDRIYSLDLIYQGSPAQFVIKTMEEINAELNGAADDPHRHNYYTVIWPVEATGKHIIDFKSYDIERNNIFFVSPYQVHQVIINPDPTGFVIQFTQDFLQKNSIRNDFIDNLKLFKNIGETPPLPLDDTLAERLRGFSENMLSAFHSHTDLHLETIGAYLKLFLIECNGHCSLVPDTNLQNIEVSKSLVKRFKELVESNFKKWHQVKFYAENLNVTPNYINEVIREALDTSAKEYIQDRLILEARRSVVYTDKSAKEIGFDLGFDDPSHFSKFFKSHTGQTLAEFRENLKS